MAHQVPSHPIGFRLAHELEGLLLGVRADGVIKPEETDRIARWLAAAAPHRRIAPFSELANRLEIALSDGTITLDECDDLVFVARRLTTVNPHFDAMRSGLQVLMGLIAGVAADGLLPDSERDALLTWSDEWSHLKGLWPFDECEALAVAAANGRLDRDAIDYFTALSQQFPLGNITPDGELVPLLVSGVCAVDPTIDFEDKTFVFTGESQRFERAALQTAVEDRNGRCTKNVSKKTDYVVVCAEGSRYWAFSCFGRKISEAYDLRKAGHALAIVAEADFHDAVAAQAAPGQRKERPRPVDSHYNVCATCKTLFAIYQERVRRAEAEVHKWTCPECGADNDTYGGRVLELRRNE